MERHICKLIILIFFFHTWTAYSNCLVQNKHGLFFNKSNISVQDSLPIKIKENQSINKYYKTAKKYFKDNDFTNALKFYLKIDSIAAQHHILNETTVLALRDRAEILKLYFTHDAMELALTLVQEALQKAEKLGKKSLIANVKLLLSEILFYVDKPDEALKYLKECETFFRKNNDPVRMARVFLLYMSYYKSDKKDLVKTDSILKAGIAYLSGKNVPKNLAEMHMYYGELLNLKSKYRAAIKHFLKADSLYFKSHPKPNLHYIYLLEGLSQAYEHTGQETKALEYLKKAYQARKEYYKKQNWDISRKLEAKYENKQKQYLLQKAKAKNLELEQQKFKQRTILLSVSFIFLLIGLFYYFQHRRRKELVVKLKELDQAKSEFFSNISHEFRTPLTLIITPVLQKLQQNKLSEQHRNFLTGIHYNANRLLELVDQILDLSKLKSDFLKLNVTKQLQPDNFFTSLCHGFQSLADQKDIQYEVKIDIQHQDVWFDRDIVQKIITNLTGNAFKYTPEGGEIKINIYVEDNNLKFDIKNTGKNLKKADFDNIFERFYQKDRQSDGLGLGLFFVKQLVKLHKGKLFYASENNYNQFGFIIPVTKKSYTTVELISATTPASDDLLNEHTSNDGCIIPKSEHPVLLIVEDNIEMQKTIGGIFQDCFKIIFAGTGKEGVQKAIEHIPDIVISDIMMPDSDGIELCKKLKANIYTNHIPVVLLTAKAGDEAKIKGLETGAADYVAKPFNPKILKLKINNLLKLRQNFQEKLAKSDIFLSKKSITVTNENQGFLDLVKQKLQKYLTKTDFTADFFARELGMSRMQLHRKLKAITGQSTTEFIRIQRVKLASELLKISPENISNIAYQVGFNDPKYFSKCFKKQFGVTPTEFIKNNSTKS